MAMGYTAKKASSDSASLSAETDGDAERDGDARRLRAESSLMSVDDSSPYEGLRAFVGCGVFSQRAIDGEELADTLESSRMAFQLKRSDWTAGDRNLSNMEGDEALSASRDLAQRGASEGRATAVESWVWRSSVNWAMGIAARRR